VLRARERGLRKAPAPRVRLARRRFGLQLRIDGALASLHQSGPGLTGIVWWMLAAGLVLLPARRRRRVLLLGLGAGSVAQALRALDPKAELVGIERDRDVLRLARRHFGLGRLGVEVIVEDAFAYLRRERRRFDLVVEDLFVGPLRTVHKPPGLVPEGFRLIGRRLRRGGLVASNTIHEGPAVMRAMRPLDGRIVSLDVHGYWNRIVLCGRGLPPPRELRRRLRAHPALAPLMEKVTVRSASRAILGP
jgi:MYXO-CTERM domain-containing protein